MKKNTLHVISSRTIQLRDYWWEEIREAGRWPPPPTLVDTLPPQPRPLSPGFPEKCPCCHVFSILVHIQPLDMKAVATCRLEESGWSRNRWICRQEILLNRKVCLPRKFAKKVCPESLPRKFAEKVCRESLPRKLAEKVCRPTKCHIAALGSSCC